jgi:hypothetical protein
VQVFRLGWRSLERGRSRQTNGAVNACTTALAWLPLRNLVRGAIHFLVFLSEGAADGSRWLPDSAAVHADDDSDVAAYLPESSRQAAARYGVVEHDNGSGRGAKEANEVGV